VLALAPAASAVPIDYDVTTGGIVTGFVCQFGFQCAGGSGDFAYDPPGGGFDAATGTITIDDSNLTIDLALSVSSATFLDTAGALNGVDEIEFSNLSYDGTALAYSDVGGQIVIDAGQSITISGDYEQFLLGSNVQGPDAFINASATVSAGLCNLGDTLVCSFDFGAGGTSLGIGPAGSQVTRRFVHGFTVDPAHHAPEPGTALLVGLGLLAVAAARRIV
jgi:hypothetical protein